MAKKTHYAVRVGHKSMQITSSWEACRKLVDGCSGAEYQGFCCLGDAKKYLNDYKPKKKNKQQGVDTRVALPEDMLGIFIPPTEVKDKFGYFKPLYYLKDGVRMAHYGRTIGENYVQSNDTTVPWND